MLRICDWGEPIIMPKTADRAKRSEKKNCSPAEIRRTALLAT
jgi:hypothetical protein